MSVLIYPALLRFAGRNLERDDGGDGGGIPRDGDTGFSPRTLRSDQAVDDYERQAKRY